jgi:hypothetical protein
MMMLVVLAVAALQGPEDERCWRSEVHNGIKVQAYLGDRACLSFDPPRTIEGVWINQFEGSEFFEGARDLSDVGKRRESVWFRHDEQSTGLARVAGGHAYRIRFLGRNVKDMHRRACFNGYGHMGCSEGLVLVDSVLELTDLGPAQRMTR